MRVAASTLMLCALVGAASGQESPNPTASAEVKSWFEPTEPVRIVGSIYYVGTSGLGAYLITTPKGHILLDGAMPQSAEQIEASIRKLGFKPEEIRLLLITHAHVDHVGTLAHFKKLTGAEVAVMAEDIELLKSGGKTDYLYAKQPTFHFEPVTADRVLKDGDTVTLGGVTLTARRTPGHTLGCTTWITTVEDGERSYNVVFPGSTSINPGTRLVVEPSYPGIADDYRRSLRMLESLDPDIFLAGHASLFDFEEKRARAATEGVQAFVDSEGYRRRIAAEKAAFETDVAKETAAPPGLGGTSWRLIAFHGSDDKTLTPDGRAKYTISFGTDGGVSARVDCNRGRGTWKSSGPNQLELGPLALTRAMCPPAPLNDRIVKDWSYVRSYVLRDGHLFLSLMADGGIYEFEPIPGARPAPVKSTEVDVPHSAGRPVKTKGIVADGVRALLQRQSQALVDAIATGSVAVWDKYLDPQVVYVDESGKVSNKKEMLEQIKPLPVGVSGTIQVTNFDVAILGDVAVASYVNDEHEDYHGHKLHCQYRTTDTWKKAPEGWRLVASQVLALRTDPPAIALPASTLESYCGRYALTPAIVYEIRRTGDGLEGQQTGHEPEELRAEAPDVLFVPGRPRYRYILLRDSAGAITGIAQRREAWDLVWKREG